MTENIAWLWLRGLIAAFARARRALLVRCHPKACWSAQPKPPREARNGGLAPWNCGWHLLAFPKSKRSALDSDPGGGYY